MKTILLGLGLGCAVLATPVLAQEAPAPDSMTTAPAPAADTMAAPATPQTRPDERQAVQEQRIQQGVQSGDITHHEAHKLQNQQDKIAEKADDMRAENGGYLNHNDRKELRKDQRKAAKKIRKAENNDDVR